MSETTGPRVPGRTTTDKAADAAKEATDKAADAAKDATDKVADEAKGIRARVRAIRSDYDMETIEKDAKPFLTGALIAGAMIVDPVLGTTVAVNRIGRYVQAHHRRSTATKVSE